MRVHVNELKVGDKVGKNIYSTTGALIVSKDEELTKRDIAVLIGFGVKYVDIDPIDKELSENNEEATVQTVERKLKRETSESLKEFVDNPNNLNIENMKRLTSEIIESIKTDKSFNYDMQDYFDRKEMFDHSVRVACYSIVIGKIHNNKLHKLYPDSAKDYLINLEDIAIAAVLHNIGKTCNKDGKLDKITEIPYLENLAKVFSGIKKTPLDHYDKKYSAVYAYSLIANIEQISKEAKKMVLLSHEPESERGCLKIPFGVNNTKLPFMYGAKIIHACDVFDNAMQDAINSNQSLEQVAYQLDFYAKNGFINTEIQQSLINNIPLYPVQTKVKLSNNRNAIVVNSRLGKPSSSCFPVVKDVDSNHIIDLMETTDITITSVIDGEKIPKAQIDTVKDKLINSRQKDEELR